MFETSVIQSPPRATNGRLSLLTVSIIAHSAVILGAIVVSVATVDFPNFAPDEFAQLQFVMPISVPPPLGVPNGGAVRQPEPARPATPPPAQPNQITAPSTVPEEVRPAATESTIASTSTEGIPGATSTEQRGELWGKEGSLGPLNAPPSVVDAPPVEEKIYLPHEVKAPVAIFKPSPPYPQVLARTRMGATVVVRCVIDKNGHVRDPRVIVPAMAPFNDAVVATVQRWRYTPGSLRGQAVESYLDVTVHFSVN